jgi:hypothetical protein
VVTTRILIYINIYIYMRVLKIQRVFTISICSIYYVIYAYGTIALKLTLAAPSAPHRLRAFVTYQRGRRSKRRQQIRVDIRWSRPSDPGGVITSYHVFMTSDLLQEAWNQTSLAGEQLTNKFSIPDVPKNMVLYFKVIRVSYAD